MLIGIDAEGAEIDDCTGQKESTRGVIVLNWLMEKRSGEKQQAKNKFFNALLITHLIYLISEMEENQKKRRRPQAFSVSLFLKLSNDRLTGGNFSIRVNRIGFVA